MATTIRTTDLDFDNIKSRLKTFFQSKSEFADYDFEASGLSNILDVLAYNTHINGLIANFALNESFLNTAQLRSSVVSHAEILGYVPRSKTASKAVVKLSLSNSAVDRPSRITLPSNWTFTTEIDDQSYTFQTREAYVAVDDGTGTYNFLTSSGSDEIILTEGIEKTKTFLVGDTGDQQVYVIPDITIDTTTLTVKVYEATTSSDFVTYSNINTAIRINPDSRHYSIKEVPNGYYEIIFGDGSTLGQAPVSGNKVEITYLSSNGADANAGDTFTSNNFLTVGASDYPISVTTVAESSGGSDKEGIESIRSNAPSLFASQQRMVTAEDYKAQILSKYSEYLIDAVSWGGEENVPPIYGRAYVSLRFVENTTEETKQVVKNDIVNNLSKNLSVMGIDTVFADPINTYLELITTFNFDPDQTNITPRTAENDVLGVIRDYFVVNLARYGTVFRRSNILTEIDRLTPAILNSRMDVRLQQRFTPVVNEIRNYKISFPVPLQLPNKETYTLTSSKFTFNGIRCTFRNKLNSSVIQIIDVLGNLIASNIGSYDAETGVVDIIGTNIENFEGDNIKISVVPFNQSTVRPLRNYLLTYDPTRSTARAIIDRQRVSTAVTL